MKDKSGKRDSEHTVNFYHGSGNNLNILRSDSSKPLKDSKGTRLSVISKEAVNMPFETPNLH